MPSNPPRTIGAQTRYAHLILGALFVLCSMFIAPMGHAVPLAVYGGLPSVEDVALSPDGTRVAYVRTEGDQRIVIFATVADRKMVRWVKIGGEKLRSLEWADDDNVLLTSSITDSLYGFRGERYLLRVYSLSRNEVRSLPGNVLQMDPDNHILDAVFGALMVRHSDGHTLVFVSGVDVKLGAQFYRCDLTTRSTRVVRAYDESSSSWLVDAQGQLAPAQWIPRSMPSPPSSIWMRSRCRFYSSTGATTP